MEILYGFSAWDGFRDQKRFSGKRKFFRYYHDDWWGYYHRRLKSVNLRRVPCASQRRLRAAPGSVIWGIRLKSDTDLFYKISLIPRYWIKWLRFLIKRNFSENGIRISRNRDGHAGDSVYTSDCVYIIIAYSGLKKFFNKGEYKIFSEKGIFGK